jgi:type 1 glutamine amidotransferase
MRFFRLFTALAVLGLFALGAHADDKKPIRVLFVTHSGGFVHDSIGVAEQVMKEIGPKNGFEVTCWRYTNDPDAKVKVKKKVDGKDVEMETTALAKYSEQYRGTTGEKGKPGEEVTKENCGRINADTLKKFDVVFFFTTGNPVDKDELKDLIAWVKAGGGFAGTHCATDTLYNSDYGQLIGGYFDGHPWHQKVKLKVEDPKHPGVGGFKSGDEITDEIYQFKEPYSRDQLHVILSIDDSSIDVKKGKRADQDYAVAWCRDVGKGRVFYTSLGHRREVWRDPRFQESVIGGLKWAAHQAKGDATPSSKLGGDK